MHDQPFRNYPPIVPVAVGLMVSLLAAASVLAQQAARSTARSAAARNYPSTGAIGDAYFSVDPETRRVVIIADEDTTAHISQVISNLDRPKPQVLIKVVFLEVTHNKALDIGIEGGWSGGDSPAGAAVNAFGLSGLSSAASTNTLLNRFGQPVQSFAPVPPGAGMYQILGENYEVTLRAIAQAGKARVLSRPSILARNNQPATITVGQQVPLITNVRYDTFGNAINSVTYQDVGVILRVTPFITSDDMVEMIVQPEISSVDTSTSVPISTGVNAPVINIRAADTVAVTPNGQTVIIGGLLANTKASSESKIPVLGDIPLLGNLFKRRVQTGADTELMIFLTPYIVPGATELTALTEQERLKSDAHKSLSERELERFLDELPQPDVEPDAKTNSQRQ